MSATRCRHGIDLQQTCRKCGRVKVVRIPKWEEFHRRLSESIEELENATNSLMEEIEKAQAEEERDSRPPGYPSWPDRQ
ncbi:MAG: hypothetical protein M3164_05515 [Actinomycetota bacterium]|nr:hypothetical protein [Actinomycetota bacterium]